MKNRLLKTGIIGSIVSALCCFTPILVFLVGAMGLGIAIPYLDLVLLPSLAFFLMVTGIGLWRHRKR